MSNSLSRALVFANASVPAPVKVEVPEWGGHVFVEYAVAAKSVEVNELFRLAGDLPGSLIMVIAFTVDADGNNLFTMEDIDFLKSQSMSVIARIAGEAARVNGFGDNKIEEAEKNSEVADS